MFIPGQIIAVLTFPGVIVHEFAHRIEIIRQLERKGFRFRSQSFREIVRRETEIAPRFFGATLQLFQARQAPRIDWPDTVLTIVIRPW